MSCASCGRPVAVDDRFCSHCGAPQAATTEERRIVTVLFADIVGFTSLAEGMDPEDVKHLVDRAFERLARDIRAFGGAVDKVLGDGIIALFGAPIAHEDDAERAVRAALRMQETIASLNDGGPRIRMRIGLNTGEVLVGTTTAGGDYTAMGDVMNSAQRLQSMAEPGRTLVGAATRNATGDAIAYLPAGEMVARGREQPIEAWVAVETLRPPGLHRQRGVAFVGRRHELAMLESQARLAVDGSRAQLALVVGEAGMGKTRLASEAAHAMEMAFSALVIEGRCLPYGEANVWWPIADLIRQLFDIPPDADIDAAEAILRPSLASRLDAASARDLDRTATALLHSLGYDTPLRGGDRNRNRSEVKLAFTTVLETELAHSPVVMVLSDMHWAAAAVWELVDHLLTELARSRLMVVATSRGGGDDELAPRGRRYGLSIVQLGPLDDLSAAALLSELGLEIAPTAVADLVDRGAGNPLFLEELAGLVAKRGLAPLSQVATDPDDLPATLRGIIAARLDELDQGERALLEDASVLGRTGQVEALVTLAHELRGGDDVHVDLNHLVEKDLLDLDGTRYRFRSDLVRDVVYGRLTKTTRAQQHFGIAQYLEKSQGPTVRNSVAVAIAEHYRAAAQLSAEVALVPGIDRIDVVSRALHWLDQAGERALIAGEPKQAARWYDSGVALAADDASLARFVYGRAKARTEIHDIAGARADLDRLESLSDMDPVTAAKALLVRGDVDRKAGDLDLAAARLREAADRLAAFNVTDQQSLALRLLGMTEMVRSHDALARQALESSRAVALAAGDRRGEAWALQTLAWHAFRLGRVGEARSLVEQAIDIFSEIDDQGGTVWAQGVLAWVAFHTGAWDEAQLLVDTVLPETRRRGDPWTEGIMLNLDASLHLWSGRAQMAQNLAQEARDVADRLDDATLGRAGPGVTGAGPGGHGPYRGRQRGAAGGVLPGRRGRRQRESAPGRERQLRLGRPAGGAGAGHPLGRPVREPARGPGGGGRDRPDRVAGPGHAPAGGGGRGGQPAALGPGRLGRGGGLLRRRRGGDGGGGPGASRRGRSPGRADTGRLVHLPRPDLRPAGPGRAAHPGRRRGRAGTGPWPTPGPWWNAPTTSRPGLLIELVAAIYGAGVVAEADHALRDGGMDPAGWTTAWALVARPATPSSA